MNKSATPPSIQIGLCNPKNATNMGAILRASGCFGAEHIFYTGSRIEHSMKYHTDTQNRAKQIPLTATDDLLQAKSEQSQVVVIELVEGAVALPEFTHPEHAIYVFGPEDGSVPQNIIDKADHVVFIPTTGCLNLAATVNVLLYDRLAKSQQKIDPDQLIKKSRDTNNRLKVKM